MTEQLPGHWLGLLSIVVLLGLRHGLDADHLVAIDGLSRFNAVRRPRLARWSGFLFSFGHGVVVTLVAAAVGLWARRWAVPAWLDAFGTWVSIALLTALGVLNLRAVLRTRPDEVVRSVGLKGRLFTRFSQTSRPVAVVLVGALFALSFDTLSQTSLLSLAAYGLGGWAFAAALGLMFMVGMMVTDGMNGLWVSNLLRRADRRALVASRMLGLTIANLSFVVALFSLLRLCSHAVGRWQEGREIFLGLGVIVMLSLSYWLALRLTRDAAVRTHPLHGPACEQDWGGR
jgi:nickel/cobalt transporter (NiCoT) family protein